MTVDAIRTTTDDKVAGVLRLLLAMVFLMSGAMKLLVPMLAEAWSGQLVAANLPFYTLSRWSVPFVEIAVGAALAVGAFSRVASVVVMAIMVVATYVHVVVDDPSLFPLQPSEPALLGQTIMGMGPEGFSRACSNLALLAIGVSFAWNQGSSQT